MTIYGYARCSCESRDNGGPQDVERQIRDLLNMGVKSKKDIFYEYISGTKKNSERPELSKLLNILKENDVIMCVEVSRISRSILDLSNIIEIAKTKKIKLQFGDFSVDFTKNQVDPFNLGVLMIIGVIKK